MPIRKSYFLLTVLILVAVNSRAGSAQVSPDCSYCTDFTDESGFTHAHWETPPVWPEAVTVLPGDHEVPTRPPSPEVGTCGIHTYCEIDDGGGELEENPLLMNVAIRFDEDIRDGVKPTLPPGVSVSYHEGVYSISAVCRSSGRHVSVSVVEPQS